MNGTKLIEWAEAVKERDRHTCQNCGSRFIQLNAHHIIHKASYPEFAYTLINGITLCLQCHNDAHPELPSYMFEKQNTPKKKHQIIKSEHIEPPKRTTCKKGIASQELSCINNGCEEECPFKDFR